MGFRKEVVFLRARVGGGSEASCLSSFNWFSVAIGASAFFSPSPPMKVQHFRAKCLDSDLHGGVGGVVQDFTLIIVYIKWRAAHFRGNVWFRRSLSQREGFLSTQPRGFRRSADMHWDAGGEEKSCVGELRRISSPLFCQSRFFVSSPGFRFTASPGKSSKDLSVNQPDMRKASRLGEMKAARCPAPPRTFLQPRRRTTKGFAQHPRRSSQVAQHTDTFSSGCLKRVSWLIL